MSTPIFLTGFEYGSTPTQNGSGLAENVTGTPTLVTSPVHSGVYAMKLTLDGATAQYMRMPITGTPQIGVVRFYLRLNAVASAAWPIASFHFLTAAGSGNFEITTGRVLRATIGAGAAQTGPTLTLDQWYCVEGRMNITGTTWTLDWRVDGVDYTQATLSGQATTDSIIYFRFGSSTASLNTGVCFFDDYIYSETSADYPFGPGKTAIIVPVADGTHVAGTNIMEDQAGADIGVVTAWNLIDDIPMSTATTYIRQLAIGTGNYAEILFGDIQRNDIIVIAAMAVLAYTSETTSANNGGCIISADGFSTSTTVWGAPGALSDYSDGSTSNLFYKSAKLANVNNLSAVNNLKARMGYSGDATPDPYWINLAVEVAYYEISNVVNVKQAVNRAAVI